MLSLEAVQSSRHFPFLQVPARRDRNCRGSQITFDDELIRESPNSPVKRRHLANHRGAEPTLHTTRVTD